MVQAATDNRGRRPRRVEPTFHPFFKKQGKRKVQYGYRVCWYVGEERKRAWVASEKEAQELVEAKRAEGGLRAVGVNLVPTKLSPSQIESAERAFDLLHEANFLDVRDATTSPQLIAAVEWFLRRYEDPSKAPSVSEYVKVFARSRAQRDKRTRQDYASCLKLFVEAG